MEPTVEQHHTYPSELDDTDFATALRLGAIIGIPLTFIIALLISLAGAGWPSAAAIAVWPALMGGPWVGGAITLIRRLSELDTPAHVTHLPARPVTSPLDHREAA